MLALPRDQALALHNDLASIYASQVTALTYLA